MQRWGLERLERVMPLNVAFDGTGQARDSSKPGDGQKQASNPRLLFIPVRANYTVSSTICGSLPG